MLELFRDLQDFLDLGGQILAAIMVLALLMWALIIERLIYLAADHRRLRRRVLNIWQARAEHHSWHAHRIREQLLSIVSIGLERNLSLIGVCVALAPLLGLLGTVTGMIEVFDAMALSGLGNARAMASGVARATIPTMAGMVVAISGLALLAWLQRQSRYQRNLLTQYLTVEGA